jgi:hypothetical protein
MLRMAGESDTLLGPAMPGPAARFAAGTECRLFGTAGFMRIWQLIDLVHTEYSSLYL